MITKKEISFNLIEKFEKEAKRLQEKEIKLFQIRFRKKLNDLIRRLKKQEKKE